MGFEILDFDEKAMYEGQLIQYNVSPILGIKMGWLTEITKVEKNAYFIDNQRIGPYKLWHHKHFFEAKANSVLMTDVVHYSLPFGFLGEIAHAIFVKNKLKSIFEFRKNIINSFFNGKS